MATAAEFWNKVQPGSGLTVEQELVALWEHMRDCPCKEKRKRFVLPHALLRDLYQEDEALIFIL